MQQPAPFTGLQINDGEKHQTIHSVNISLDSERSELECACPVTTLHLGLDRAAQFGGVLGVILAVNQHQRNPLVVLDDVGHAAEILEDKKKVGMESSLK